MEGVVAKIGMKTLHTAKFMREWRTLKGGSATPLAAAPMTTAAAPMITGAIPGAVQSVVAVPPGAAPGAAPLPIATVEVTSVVESNPREANLPVANVDSVSFQPL